MRRIGTVAGEADARRLADYLLTLAVTTQLTRDSDGWAVWVHQEDKVHLARTELDAFLGNPSDPKYTGRAAEANALRKQAEREQQEHLRKSIDVRYLWSPPDLRRCPVTFTLIGLSIAAYFLLNSSWGDSTFRAMTIASFQRVSLSTVSPEEARDGAVIGNQLIRSDLPSDLARGEVWRLVTPIFLHADMFHLLFNMSMLYMLGCEVEIRRGSLKLLLLVLVSAVASNLGQYLYTWSPLFGGMSGVDLAIFGYVWMKGMYEPDLGLGLSSGMVMFVVLYLAVTIAWNVTFIAHGAHLVGVAVGVLAGIGPHLIPKTVVSDE